jgi:hypothetical protein
MESSARYFSLAPLAHGVVCALGLVLGATGSLRADAGVAVDGPHAPYRADLAPAVERDSPDEFELLRPPGARPWPAAVQEDLRRQVLDEWPGRSRYGTITSAVGVWLEFPLVNSLDDGRVVVPVLEETKLRVRGRLVIPRMHASRIVILVDVSHSANAQTPLLGQDGSIEHVPVLEAELRAADRLLNRIQRDRDLFGHLPAYEPTEVGIIAFGEGTWEVLEPVESIERARARLADLGQRWDEGSERTDAVCAIRLAEEWLETTPDGAGREILILTNGDLPFSGRFTDCGAPRFRDEASRRACRETLNLSPCAASHRFDPEQGRSDVAQLFSFAREARGRVRVSPLLFQLEPPPRYFRELALTTSGQAVGIASEMAIEHALSELFEKGQPPLAIQGVFARNLHTAEETENLLEAGGIDFAGTLPLEPGSNDVEVRIESDRGRIGLLRFRVYAARDPLRDFLTRIGDANRELEEHLDELIDDTRTQMRAVSAPRELEVTLDTEADDGRPPSPGEDEVPQSP